MIGAIYARVSTDDQEDNGTSLDTQVEASLKFCESRGIEVPSYYIVRETWSGYDKDRPGLNDVREWIRRGKVEALVSYAVDRLSRSQAHMWLVYDDIKEADALLDFVTENFEDTTTGRFILASRAFVAETEREKIKERMERGRKYRQARGKLPTGSVPMFGYIYDKLTGIREIDPVTNPALRYAGEKVMEGKSLREACRLVRDRFNLKLSDSTLGGLLRNPAIYGRTMTNKNIKIHHKQPGVYLRPESEWEHIEGATPLTFTLEEEQKIRTALEHNRKRLRKGSQYFYALRGHVFCRGCGIGIVSSSHHRYSRRTYRHDKKDRHDGTLIQCDRPRRHWEALTLEDRVWREHIIPYFENFDTVRESVESLADKVRGGEATKLLELKQKEVEENIEAAKQRVSRLSIAWTRGRLDDQEYESEASTAEIELRNLERALSNTMKQLGEICIIEATDLDRIAIMVASGLFEIDGDLEEVLDYAEGQAILTFTTSGDSYVTPDPRTPKGRRAWELKARVFEALQVRVELWGEEIAVYFGVPIRRLLPETFRRSAERRVRRRVCLFSTSAALP